MSNLISPLFPKFKKIGISDSAWIKPLLKEFPPYSDFGFTSMYSWNTNNEMSACILNGNLCVLFEDYESDDKFISLLGKSEIDKSLQQALKYSADNGLGVKLRLVPETVIKNIVSKNLFLIEEDRDNFDYVLSAEFLAKLEGAKNEDRRYRIKKFLAKYEDELRKTELDLTLTVVQDDINKCLQNWTQKRDQEQANDTETVAITRLLNSADKLSTRGLGFYINGTLSAFSIYEELSERFAVVHFEKCDLSYQGIVPYVRHEVFKEIYTAGIPYINYEQDLGIEGLRKSKEMLHPVDFLKKYTVRLK